VHGRCFPRHTHVEFLAFLKSLSRHYPKRELHLLCDNYGTHKHPAVNEWLAAHPRIRLHFTPSSASWLNLVGRWFAIISGQAIRRGSFDSVRRLEAAIMNWLSHWNDNAQPFRWTKSAADIKRSIRKCCTYLRDTTLLSLA
jgi:transposase